MFKWEPVENSERLACISVLARLLYTAYWVSALYTFSLQTKINARLKAGLYIPSDFNSIEKIELTTEKIALFFGKRKELWFRKKKKS